MEGTDSHEGEAIPTTSKSHIVAEVDNFDEIRDNAQGTGDKECTDIREVGTCDNEASDHKEPSENFDSSDVDLSQCIAVFPGEHDIESFDASHVVQKATNGEKVSDSEEDTRSRLSALLDPQFGDVDLSECLAVFPGGDCQNQEIDLSECLAVFPGHDYRESRDPSLPRSQETDDSDDHSARRRGSKYSESSRHSLEEYLPRIKRRRSRRPYGASSYQSDSDTETSDDTSSGTATPDLRYNPFAPKNPGERSHRVSSNLLPKTPDEDQISPGVSSAAEEQWRQRKQESDEESVALDHLMALVGLEQVKSEFLQIKSMIDAARSRKGVLRKNVLNLVLSGNPGTGIRTVAGLYSDFLRECGIWNPKHDYEFHHWSGFKIQDDDDISELRSDVDKGFLFITHSDRIKFKCRAHLFNALEELSEKVVVVVAGPTDSIADFLGAAPEGAWLFPRRLQLSNYDDDELRRILIRIINDSSMTVEGGLYGSYPRILAKRVGRRRDGTGFGNIHELKLAFEEILKRQAVRLRNERPGDSSVEEQVPDEHFLTMKDMIGPEPEDIRSRSAAWKELQSMAGLEDVKNVIDELLGRAKVNYHREVHGMKLVETSLNRVFLGPPGTGKTTVAKLYGRILADIGLLSTQEVVYKTPADFIGEYIGESETKTNQIINATRGKVLIIDDAHMFYHGTRPGTSNESDEFRLACIDVLISKIHNKPREDRCVILLGYPDMMEEMFQKCNPGLRRRFPLEEAFRFTDYNDQRLNEILALKMKAEGIVATESAMETAAEVLRRARDRPNFGNGGDVENLINQARINHRKRTSKVPEDSTSLPCDDAESSAIMPSLNLDALDPCNAVGTAVEILPITLEPEDFDPEYDRGTRASEKCRHLFHGLVGFDGIVQRFETYQRTAANLRLAGKDPRENIPFTYVFKGSPGTGKTHTAQIVGKIFHDMGFLSTSEVIECSATHLVGEYMGHTGPKIINLFDRALGKVLFIDEAYRLGFGGGSRTGSFIDEAIGELVDCMTKPRYFRKMIIVLAGYDREMDALMKVNAGLRGRFATEITFPSLSPMRCLEHLRNLIRKEDIEMQDESAPSKTEAETVLRLFQKLSMTRGWSNGRDIKTLAGTITTHMYGSAEGMEKRGNGKLTISHNMLIGFLKDLLRHRIKGGAA